MVPFSGWDMPVQYTGIIEEHMHTRSRAGLFDICHMGEFILKGPRAGADIDKIVTRNVSNMPAGKCRYTFLLNEKGGIIDDLIVFKIAEGEYMLVVNAGTLQKDKEWIEKHLSGETIFFDDSENITKIDIQGPDSAKVLSEFTEASVVEGIGRFSFATVDIEGVKVLLSRTGYTGELGYELYFPKEQSGKIWDILIGSSDVRPVGLGARDTLRMEMGYSLYGSDIDEEHTPLEANLEKFVDLENNFIGKDVLIKQHAKGVDRLLTGFICEGRRSARSHFKVISDGKEVGEVTSGSFSPCLKKGIGLCYIDKELASEGTEIVLTDGRVEIKATIKNAPLYEKGAPEH